MGKSAQPLETPPQAKTTYVTLKTGQRLEYLQLPPRTCIPTWMVQDHDLMEAWAQEIQMHMPSFPVEGPEDTCLYASDIMLWDESNQRKADLGASRGIQPTAAEVKVYACWNRLDSMVWELAEMAAKGRPAPREVRQLRRLNNAVNANTACAVSKKGWRLVRQQAPGALTENQAFNRPKAPHRGDYITRKR